jgi:hypothetical protein
MRPVLGGAGVAEQSELLAGAVKALICWKSWAGMAGLSG